MKKLIYCLLGLLALSFGANAQLRVLSNGHIQLGDWDPSPFIVVIPQPAAETNAVAPGLNTQINDTTTTISILGVNSKNLSGGTLAFGGRRDVMIEEKEFTRSNSSRYGTMSLIGLGGLNYEASNGTIFSYTPPVISTRPTSFTYSVNVTAPAYLTSSDVRFKSNIQPLEDMGSLLEDLTPVSYNLNVRPVASDREDNNIQKSIASNSDNDHRSFGFIAQEVREIFPNLVYEDNEGMLSVDYNGFIPLLVDAYKTLSAKVVEQEALIAALSDSSRKAKGTAAINDIDSEEAVVLMQNRPNPFRDTTEIRCSLPETISDAFISLYDLNGRQQMRLPISARGEVSVTVSGGSLLPGIYIYSLIADGQEKDTKRMILTE